MAVPRGIGKWFHANVSIQVSRVDLIHTVSLPHTQVTGKEAERMLLDRGIDGSFLVRKVRDETKGQITSV